MSLVSARLDLLFGDELCGGESELLGHPEVG
jgi:hypothetical protein